ncbi:nicotinamidase-related amidase [Natronocella acetinitrilica]|uniref:Nicotinamidase-related amidase n=1 Tax=Natronocella acetinitrilica TaxID=414046 RepID=A0AAE3G7Q1_9GAMM|nr:isochorismatase family protein [Natronocella acetinitrilica]MCP1676982.1 nicotinamidase-related amidase [Natronocella acetinitrilica]
MALESNRLKPAKCYALLIIDASVGFTDPQDSPLGMRADDAIAAIQRLQQAVQARDWPVYFTSVVYERPDQQAVFREKLPALNVLSAGSALVEIDPRLNATPPAEVIVKTAASGFFGTDLAERLAADGVDGVVVTGFSTSGCVRATAVDALQHDFRVIVPREAVADRDPSAHSANLYDLNTKYADVLSLEETLARLAD